MEDLREIIKDIFNKFDSIESANLREGQIRMTLNKAQWARWYQDYKERIVREIK